MHDEVPNMTALQRIDSDSDDDVYHRPASNAKKKKRPIIVRSSSEETEDVIESTSTNIEAVKPSRSSERIRKRKSRVFEMPTKKIILGTVEHSTHRLLLRANDLMAVTNRYNNDDSDWASSSGESSVEFINDDSLDMSQVDLSMYRSQIRQFREDSSFSSSASSSSSSSNESERMHHGSALQEPGTRSENQPVTSDVVPRRRGRTIIYDSSDNNEEELSRQQWHHLAAESGKEQEDRCLHLHQTPSTAEGDASCDENIRPQRQLKRRLIFSDSDCSDFASDTTRRANTSKKYRVKLSLRNRRNRVPSTRASQAIKDVAVDDSSIYQEKEDVQLSSYRAAKMADKRKERLKYLECIRDKRLQRASK